MQHTPRGLVRLEDSGNVFYGTIIAITTGDTTDIVTIRLDATKPIELTISYTPVPPVGGAGKRQAVDDASSKAPNSDEYLGEHVRVVVPVPMGFLAKG